MESGVGPAEAVQIGVVDGGASLRSSRTLWLLGQVGHVISKGVRRCEVSF